VLHRKGNYRLAIAAFKKSFRNWPADYQALWAIAECYSEMKRPRIAVRYWEKAISIAGTKDELLFNLGNAFLDSGELSKAISYYNKITRRTKSVYRMASKNKLRAHKMLAAE